MIKKVEEIIGKPLSQLEAEDIPSICKNKEFIEIMADKTAALEISGEVIQCNRDKRVLDEFIPIKISSELYLAKVMVSNIFRKFDSDGDRDSLCSEMLKLLKEQKDLEKLVVVLTILSALPEEDISAYAELIKTAMINSENILYKLDIDRTFPLCCDIVDLIYSVREGFFAQYEVDLLDDTSGLENIVQKLNEIMAPIFEAMQKEAENLSGGVKPEELGLLDITKLDKEE